MFVFIKNLFAFISLLLFVHFTGIAQDNECLKVERIFRKFTKRLKDGEASLLTQNSVTHYANGNHSPIHINNDVKLIREITGCMPSKYSADSTFHIDTFYLQDIRNWLIKSQCYLKLKSLKGSNDSINQVDSFFRKQGVWIKYFKTPKIIYSEGYFINDKKNGIFNLKFRNGRLISTIEYTNDSCRLETFKNYYGNGNLRKRIMTKGNDFYLVTFDNSGNIINEIFVSEIVKQVYLSYYEEL